MGQLHQLLVEDTHSQLLRTDRKQKSFQVACIEQVHCAKAFSMSYNSLFDTKSYACASTAFLLGIISFYVEFTEVIYYYSRYTRLSVIAGLVLTNNSEHRQWNNLSTLDHPTFWKVLALKSHGSWYGCNCINIWRKKNSIESGNGDVYERQIVINVKG
jgi:hypothetical protein